MLLAYDCLGGTSGYENAYHGGDDDDDDGSGGTNCGPHDGYYHPPLPPFLKPLVVHCMTHPIGREIYMFI